jgi:RNA polymerase sigma factor (sigma-70 family)
VESTTLLLRRIWQGDSRARDQLVGYYLPIVKRLAHGRLPARARGLVGTDDLVSITLEKALRHIDTFQPRREGAFLAYLRTILVNEIRSQVRRANVRPISGELDSDLPSHGESPLEKLVGLELMERYESALEQLTPEQKEAVIMRIEMGCSHQEVADALGAPSPDAARMLVTRALALLAQRLRDDSPENN